MIAGGIAPPACGYWLMKHRSACSGDADESPLFCFSLFTFPFFFFVSPLLVQSFILVIISIPFFFSFLFSFYTNIFLTRLVVK